LPTQEKPNRQAAIAQCQLVFGLIYPLVLAKNLVVIANQLSFEFLCLNGR
jgi:hypothetical protein